MKDRNFKVVKNPAGSPYPIKVLPCHIMIGEAEGFDALQGGMKEDPLTGLRDYSALAPMIAQKPIRDLLIELYKEETKNHGRKSTTLQRLEAVGTKAATPFRLASGDKRNPAKALGKDGVKGDKLIALLPQNLIMFLGDLMGTLHINKKTGFFEFFFGFGGDDDDDGGIFGSIFKIASTALGTAIGGPVGGLFGSALGGGFSNDPEDSRERDRGNNFDDMLQEKRRHNSTRKKHSPFASVLNNGAQLFNIYNATKLKEKAQEEEHRRYEEKRAKHSEAVKRNMEAAGMFDTVPHTPNTAHHNAAYVPERLRLPGYSYTEAPIAYKKGGAAEQSRIPKEFSKRINPGLLKGPGDGQADKIKTNIPEGSYIIDASSVADLGNGSSSSGGEVLSNFKDHMVRKYGHHVESRNHPELPVYLANEEYLLLPYEVAAIGEGSEKEGARRLKRMVINLRKHKNSNGAGLPPKAKSPLNYMGA